VQGRQIGDDAGTDEVVQRDGRGDEADRPAARVLDSVQVNRRPVEADAPAKYGDDEGRGGDAPAEKCAGQKWGAIGYGRIMG